MYKKYEKDENIENINNNEYNNNYNNNDNNGNNDKNRYSFVKNVTNDQGEGNINILKLQKMDYLSISQSCQIINSTYKKNKEKSSLLANNFKKKICNNTEYEYEHKYTNNIINGNLKKSCSANENSNLMKINSIISFYIRNNTKYLVTKKMKVEDIESISKKNIIINENNKNEKGANTKNNNCCII